MTSCDNAPSHVVQGIVRPVAVTLAVALLPGTATAAVMRATDVVPSYEVTSEWRAPAGTVIETLAPRGDSVRPDSVSTTGAVVGTVRGGVSGMPLAGARIVFRRSGTVPDRTTTAATASVAPSNETPVGETWSDSTGNYLLRAVPAGTGDLVATLDGYDSLALQVTVPAHGAVRVDIGLSRQRVTLAPVRVVASVSPPPTVLSPLPTTGTVDSIGTWRWSGDVARGAYATGEPDAFRMLADDPHIGMRPDGPPAVTDRGGGGDQMLVLLDGLPLWSPLHAGGTLSAVSPDVIGALTVHDGALPARYGGRLAGVLDVETRGESRGDPGAVSPATGAAGIAIGPAATRTLWDAPLRLGDATGRATVALRRSNTDLFARPRDGRSLVDRWTDGVSAFSLTHGATSVRALALTSQDQLGPTRSEATSATSSPEDTGSTATPTGTSFETPRMPWATRTVGVVWTQRVAPEAQVETRLWDAGFHTDAYQTTDSVLSTLASRVRHAGALSQLTWGATTIGASFEAFDVRYHVADTASRLATPLDLHAMPTSVTAFAEHRWGSADGWWTAETGIRTTGFRGARVQGPIQLEPRLLLAVTPISGITATAGYARTHQFIQSLRNAESPLGASIGIDFPVTAGMPGVPVATSDVTTVGVTARVAPTVSLSVDAYLRRLSGLAVADPKGTALFATRGFDVASGRISGLGISVRGREGWLAWQGSYGTGVTTYTTARGSYHPSSELGHTGTASLALQLDRRTQLRAVGWAATGHQSVRFESPSQSGVGSDGAGETESQTELSHSAYSDLSRTLDSAPLPAYLRADLSLVHDWRTGPGRGRGQLSLFLTLANVFGRTNVAAYVSGASATPRAITLTPRSLLTGVSWWY